MKKTQRSTTSVTRAQHQDEKKHRFLSVSTKTGDAGESGLADGRRLPKHSLVFTVLGDLDELNSWLGMVLAQMKTAPGRFTPAEKMLSEVQEQLFYLGAEVASARDATVLPAQLQRMEKESEKLQRSMGSDWTSKFLMPGGSELGAWLDLARSVCRRAERSLSAFAVQETVSPAARQYLNRLSDYLYVLRCYVNQELVVDERPFIKRSSK